MNGRAACGTADAPRGALQFEVTNQELAKFLAPCLWVMPERNEGTPTGQRCSCRSFYPVIIGLLPRDLQPVARAAMRAEGTNQLVICKCNGKVIE